MIVSICWILVTNFALFNSAQECVDKLDNCGLIAKRNLCEIQTYQRQCCISCGRQDSLPNNLPSNKKWVICTDIYSLPQCGNVGNLPRLQKFLVKSIYTTTL